MMGGWIMNKRIVTMMVLLAGWLPTLYCQTTLRDSLSFDKGTASSPASLLQGQVSGVRVSSYDGTANGAISTLIRGVNNLRGDSQPLWIIDGTQVNATNALNLNAFWKAGEQIRTAPLNAMFFLNPYDIESIEVIKDLSAASRYGLRGANGVIVIKTALGEEDGFRISVRSNAGIVTPSEALSGTVNGFCHNHYLNLSGVAGRTRYVVSGQLRRSEGIFSGEDALYGGLRASFETQANEVVSFGMSTILSMGKMNSVSASSWIGQPSWLLSATHPKRFENDPLRAWESDFDDESVERRLVSSMHLSFNLKHGFKWANTVGVDFLNTNRYLWYGNGLTFGRENNGAASILATTLFKYNATSALSWEKTLGARHHLGAAVAAEASGDWNKTNTMYGTDYFSHVLRARGVMQSGNAMDLHKYDHKYNTHGFYGTLSYDYNACTGFHLLGRADNTPRYDDRKYRLSWAGDAFLDLHQAFFPESRAVSTLRLTAGYGMAGWERYVPYQLYGQYLSGEYPIKDASLDPFFEGLNRIESRETTVGLSAGFFSDRLLLQAKYYDKDTDDAFLAYCFGKADGHYWDYAERQDDFSARSHIANRGIEGDLDIVILDNTLARWSIRANAAYNVNQLLKVDPLDAFGRAIGSAGLCNANVAGRSVGALLGYRLDDDSYIIDITRDGRIDENDRAVLGETVPRYLLGVGTTLRISRWTLDVVSDGAFGFDIMNFKRMPDFSVQPFLIAEDQVERGDYYRISRVSLGYDVNVNRVKWIRGLSVNASVCNPLILSYYSGWNPTTDCYATSFLTHGVDYGSYPVVRSFVLGLNLQF